ERFDTSAHKADIMGKPIPLLRVPVVAGRDVASLIEIAALNHKLRSFGYHSAVEFNQRLLKKMADDQLG
ncbi:MAG: HPr(Ser) kinase/phosphatase, partial [Verrucomicrobia bacterium]|nr:HPr(Ser) kinase/phosphatase [Verrucomicrobiota bacterium]